MSDQEAPGKNDDKAKFRPVEELDADLQREINEALGDMSLDELMAAEEAAQSEAATGEELSASGEGVRRGRVIAIQGDDIFVDMGGKSQGYLPASQFEDEPLPEIGEQVEVTIAGYDQGDGLLMLSRKGAVRAATWETLDEGQTVEGRVTGHNKGGLELTVNGIDAFMPISQIELFRVDTLDDYVNQRLQCQVTEIDRREGSVVVSRRALLEIEAEAKAKELWDSLAVGQIVRGQVRTIMPYGAFVDIGGADGLLHVSDMSHTRVDNPETIVKVGEQIEVKVLSVDSEARRISLGLKQTLPDPWAQVESKWPVDDVVTGRVTKLADFGAFVELEPGVEGLIPISEMSFERVKSPAGIVNEGDMVKVRVIGVDAAKQRISLSLKRVGDDPWIGASIRWPEGSIVEGRVSRIAEFGAFVKLSAGVEGLVHISELGGDFVRAVGDVVREGDPVQAKVLSVDEDARRISLSMKELAAAPDQAPAAGSEAEPPKRRRKKPLKGGLD